MWGDVALPAAVGAAFCLRPEGWGQPQGAAPGPPRVPWVMGSAVCRPPGLRRLRGDSGVLHRKENFMVFLAIGLLVSAFTEVFCLVATFSRFLLEYVTCG